MLARTVLVYGQMNEPPGARWRVPLTALTIAEYFRDEKHQNVLLLMDNVFRFVQAGANFPACSAGCRRASATSRRWPPKSPRCRSVSPPSPARRSLRSRRSTSRPTTSPTRAVPRFPAILESVIMLSRAHGRGGLLPGDRPAGVIVRAARSAGGRRGALPSAERAREVLPAFKDLQDIIALLGVEELGASRPPDRQARAPAAAFPQPALRRDRGVHRHAGPQRRRADTLAGCRAILDGETDDWAESSLYMVGNSGGSAAGRTAADGKAPRKPEPPHEAAHLHAAGRRR